MTTIKVADLEGAQLDYWVAMAGEEWKRAHELYPTMTLDPTFIGVQMLDGYCMLMPHNPFRQDIRPYMPSMVWEHGGPIIERERIQIVPRKKSEPWSAYYDAVSPSVEQWGETHLIAAMRCYVASKFGDTVEVQP